MDQKEFIPKKVDKITFQDYYITVPLLNHLIKETDITKRIIEEKNSELWYETLTGRGYIVFNNNIYYEGPMKNGILESSLGEGGDNGNHKCMINFPDGTKYEGDVHDNRLTGNGKFVFPSGANYEGGVCGGLRHGQGTYTSMDGITYTGEWQHGLKHGKGKMIRPNMTYDGEWKEGAIHGKGHLKWDNGNVYVGNFKENTIEGDGYMIWHDIFEKYVGEWSNNLQNGIGLHMWYEPKGEQKLLRNRFLGKWVNGVRNGYGVYIYSNGSWFEGMWVNNCKKGFGVYVMHDGVKYIGRFDNDRMIDKDNQITEDEAYDYINKGSKDDNDDKSKREESKDSVITLTTTSNRDRRNSRLDGLADDKNKLQGILKNKLTKPLNSKFSKVTQSKNMGIIEESQENSKSHDSSRDNKDPPNNNNNNNKYSPKQSKNTTLHKIKIEPNNNNNNNTTKPKTKDITRTLDSIHDKTIQIQLLQPQQFPQDQSKYIYCPFLNLSDLLALGADISITEFKEIKNTIMRILTDMRHIYNLILRGTERDIDDLITGNSIANKASVVNNNKSNLMNSSIKKQPTRKRRESNISSGPNLNTNNQLVVIHETPKTNDYSFVLSLKDLWMFIREVGFVGSDFSFCDFNRIYYNNEENRLNMFHIPDKVTKENDIYSYYKRLYNKSRRDFILKNKTLIEYYYKQNDMEVPNELKLTKNDVSDIDKELKHSLHCKYNIILPRFFNEALVRIAYLKYVNVTNMTLSKKFKTILNVIISPKSKKKSNNKSSVSKIEQSFNVIHDAKEMKDKYHDKIQFDNFLIFYENILNETFDKVYSLYTYNRNVIDRTIPFRFIYNNIICKSKILKGIITSKIMFTEIINHYHKDKMLCLPQEIKLYPLRYLNYIETLFENECIQFEFVEVVFLICKKYITEKKLHWDRNEFEFIVNEVVNVGNNTVKVRKTREVYFYPETAKHKMKEKMLKEIEIKKEMKRKREEEVRRYMRERKNMFDEKDNVYIEEEDEDEDEEYDDDY